MRRKREHRIDGGENLVLRDDLVITPRPLRIERHELDEADRHVLVTTEPREVDDLVVVHASHHDAIDLHRLQPGVLGGGDALEHTEQLIALRDGVEAVALATNRAKR